jgi:rRNA maturation RNase YbeY
MTRGLTFKSEIHRVIIHAALHLCGYGDKSKREIKEMREREAKCLNKYF